MTRPTEQPGSQPALPADATRWRGHTHEELYLLLHDGPGAAASAEPSRRWAEISTALGEIGQDLQKALEQSAAGWSGRAARAAYDRLSVTAAWATDTGTEAAGMRTAVESQAEHIARARADMPVPEDVPAAQPDPAVAPAVQVVRAQTDLEGAEAAASSAEERAFEVMAAYELNTTTTTDALSSFDAPPVLDRRDDVHQGDGVGSHHAHTSPAGLINIGLGGHGGGHGHHGHHGGWSGTNGASAPWAEPAGRGVPLLPGRGSFSGVLDPLFMSAGDRSGQRSSRDGQLAAGGSSGTGFGGSAGGSGGSGSGQGSPAPGATSSVAGGGGSAAAPPKTGPTSLGGMPASDLQAAAAGHAAAVHQASAAPPVAPAAGMAGGGGQDRMALRRFGMEAIGSNQWFGDVDEAVVGESPRRRRDFREPEQVTESVSILGEEHKLPPTVIGDGPTDR